MLSSKLPTSAERGLTEIRWSAEKIIMECPIIDYANIWTNFTIPHLPVMITLYIFPEIKIILPLLQIYLAKMTSYKATGKLNWFQYSRTLRLRYFSSLFYILHKLISLAILVLRQFCRHGRLPQKESRVEPATKSNHSTLSISRETYK